VRSKTSTGTDLGKDPQLTIDNGRAFYLARDNDLVFEVHPTCGVPIKRVSVHDLAPKDPARPAKPHEDAATRDGNTLVVPLYNAARLAFLKKTSGGEWAIDTTLDLSRFDSADGNPQADAVRIVDVGGVEKAFVTLERLDDRDGLRSKQPSQMLRVDVATRTIEATIELAGRNPFNPMAVLNGALFLAEPGNFNAADDDLAGIEKFDTATSTTRLFVKEKDLGGSVAEIAVTKGCGVAIVAGPDAANPTSLATFDPETGALLSGAVLSSSGSGAGAGAVLGPTPGYDLQGLAWKDGTTLYVGDRRAGGDGYTVHVLAKEGDSCTLKDSGRTITLPQRPVALRAAK
jgi:hypothetical protein